MAVAVRAGTPHPDISSEAGLRSAVTAAGRVAYSTGPSGDHLLTLYDRWGISPETRGRMVKAPPGVSVGSLLAQGKADLGFQQLSELIHVPGIEVAGRLPVVIQAQTMFAAGVSSTSAKPHTADEFIRFLTAASSNEVKKAQGMDAP
jgi:molybdate transport system substrate-binding protein